MDDGRKRRKNERSRAAYAAAKPTTDAALLRFEAGALARLDAARLPTQLSRSAYIEAYLLPIAEALAPSLPAIDAARRASGTTLATFVAKALARSLEAGEPPSAEPPGVATEFDSLFG